MGSRHTLTLRALLSQRLPPPFPVPASKGQWGAACGGHGEPAPGLGALALAAAAAHRNLGHGGAVALESFEVLSGGGGFVASDPCALG